MLGLHLLGAPQIKQNGEETTFDTRKAVALLAYLVVEGRSQTRDTLAALFWPDQDQSHARGALRRTLWAVRSEVGEALLQATREMVSLSEGDAVWSDVQEFEQLLDAAQSHDHESIVRCSSCLDLLNQAAALYQGDFLQGFTLRDSPEFDDWQFFESDRLRQRFAQVLETLVQAHANHGEYDKGLVVARRWLTLDLLREEAHRQLMLLYAWDGQRSAALRQYQECVRILDEELGVPPTEETIALHQKLLTGDLPPAPEPVVVPPPRLQPQPSPAHVLPLVGRAREWDCLLENYQQIQSAGRFLGVFGEAGIGKTRLVQDFLGFVREQGGVILEATCYQNETTLAYSPFQEALQAGLARPDASDRLGSVPDHWLVEAQRLLPGLARSQRAAVAPGTAEGHAAQLRLFEGLRQLIGALSRGTPPGVFFIDDLQWADSASLDLLFYLVRRLQGFPVMFLGAWRQENISSAPVRQLFADLRQTGTGDMLALERLTHSQVAQLVTSAALPDAALPRLYQETEGLPFFIMEYLAVARRTEQGMDWTTPQRIQDLQRSRLAYLDTVSVQLLAAAAVIGRSFDFETLRETSGRSEVETVAGLETLLAQGLIQEHPGDDPAQLVFDFSHERLRQVVYEDTSSMRRRLLHRRTAETLLKNARSAAVLQAKPTALPDAQIAHHFQLAGLTAEAGEYFMRAGDHARSLYANAEALDHYQKALACGVSAVDRLHEAIGDLQTLVGDYEAAAASYTTVAVPLRVEDQARLAHKLGNLCHRRGEWEQAVQYFEQAVGVLAPEQAYELRAHIFADWSRTAFQQGNGDQSRRLAEQALELAREGVSMPAQAQALNILAILARSRDNLQAAQTYLEQALGAAPPTDTSPVRTAALNNLALVYAERGAHDRAIELASEALSLCVRLGDRHREAALLNNLADFHHAANQSEAAMVYLKQAVAIFTEIGLEAGNMRPEIWGLTEW